MIEGFGKEKIAEALFFIETDMKMSSNYTIKFTRTAREDLDRCLADYGSEVHGKLWDWLNAICESAKTKNLDLVSMNMLEFLDELLEEFDSDEHVFSAFRKKTLFERIKALIYMLRYQKSPWIVRASTQSISVFSKIIESAVVFEVDHLKRRVVYRKFIDLPGQ